MTLLEKYSKRLSVADRVYARENNGKKMDNHRALVVATCIDNCARFLNEAFTSNDATQRTDMGNYKRFCLNLVNIAMPNLIAHDLVMVAPMTSMVGYVSYIEYSLGNGIMTNNPFTMGEISEERTTYTAERVVESFIGDGTKTAFTVAWTAKIDANGKLDGGKVLVDGTESTAYTAAVSNGVATITFTSAPANKKEIRIAYVYDNQVIPFNNGVGTMPHIKAEMKSIALQAKARRLAIYYSSIAAFQA